jgi:hypothetical protein
VAASVRAAMRGRASAVICEPTSEMAEAVQYFRNC